VQTIVYLKIMEQKVRKSENLHIVLWLLKDLCWVADWKLAGTIMIVPTISVAVYITIIARSSYSELMHNLAVVCWICANSIWMVGEFYFNDGTRPPAMIFFGLGLLIVGYYYTALLVKKRSGKQHDK
jgi:hypothetical protein